MVGEDPLTGVRRGTGGRSYQIEIQAIWDTRPGGNIRILASIDDGGWTAFHPLTVDFIKSPSDEFVGEDSPSGAT